MTQMTRGLALAALISLTACSSGQSGSSLPGTSPGGPTGQPAAIQTVAGRSAAGSAASVSSFMLPANVRASCAAVPKLGAARCLALLRTDVGDAIPGHVTPLDEKVPGYGPADLGL